ncbi:uncharacterized protein LOC129773509 [Toxorhynchites rutilus septentrionalis]|uniref:uncharacterized protein LOC129773509 n=1 Tax=Toxorhynchites rutilus septentrionalis TaxID=329112 RepID=UPI00247AFA37|nr:uncharacterized protein LOC129773509 [Toxorhynchites rutilus septentrionalis]
MEEYEANEQHQELTSRLEKLEPLWEKINESMTETELTDTEADEAGEKYVKERADFQNKFFTLKGFLLSKLWENPDQNAAMRSPQVSQSSSTTTSHPHVKLPLISLPKFSGDVGDWLTFRDLFLFLIHLSNELPEIEKFHYLRSQLEGEALAVISSLPLTQASYCIAWELLVKRYSNSKILRKRQVQNLFDIPNVKKESAVELHRLVEGFEKATKILDQLTEPEQYKDLVLIHLLSTRLDEKT